MEYAQRPFLIPPFIIFNHVIMLLICTWNKICCCCRKNTEQRERESDNRLKLFLEKHELKELLTFEEHCLYSYLYNKDTLFNATAEERVRVIGNRIESIATQLEETAKESFTRGMTQKKTLTAMSGRLKNLERNTKAILAMLSTRYGMSPSKYAMEIDSGDEDLDEHGHGIRREKSASELISHFKAAARNPIVRHGLKLAAAAKASKDDDSPSPPCTKRRRGSGESPATSPQASEDEKPTTSKAREFLDVASRHSKRARDDLEGVKTVHLKARRTPYPMSNVERYPLTDNQVEWKAIVLGYDPPGYTADTILSSNADANFQSITAGNVKLTFNAVDGNINRQSYTGHYDVIEGLPRNPMGRTGLVGRGLLEHWGPNHTSCHVITRWRRSHDSNIEERDKHPVLEFVAIKSHDSQEWKLPENKLTVDKTSTKAFIDELCENILLAVEPHSELTRQEKKVQLDKLLQELGMEVSHGYVDDERNTDNAWVETMVMNYHDETGEGLGELQFMVRDGKYLMAWLTASCQLNIPENQVVFLRKVAKLNNAFF